MGLSAFRRELLPPPAGGPPPSKREVWGFTLSLEVSYTTPGAGLLKRSLEDMRHRLSEKSALTLHMLHMLHMSDMLKEKDIRRKSNGFELLPPLRRSPSLKEGGLGFRRSRPPALPSIGYRGFAVAPITLRAPSRNIVVITVQINGCGNIRNGRAMRAPTVYGGATDGCKYI